MFGQKYDLPDVVGVMRHLAVQGLQNRVRFAADGDRAHRVLGLERLDC